MCVKCSKAAKGHGQGTRAGHLWEELSAVMEDVETGGFWCDCEQGHVRHMGCGTNGRVPVGGGRTVNAIGH